jgi:hypothetical protein
VLALRREPCPLHELYAVHTLLYEPDQYPFKEALIDRFDATDRDGLFTLKSPEVENGPVPRGCRRGPVGLC